MILLYLFINPRFPFLFLFLFVLCFPLPSISLNEDGHILQSFKNSIEDRYNVFASWDDADENPCLWSGIYCDPQDRVTSVELPSSHISAPFPLRLCKLPHLLYMSLYNNSLHSVLGEDMSQCSKLEYLDVSQNLLTGPLPSAIGYFPNMRYLDLSGNNFSGEIPQSFSRLKKLEVFSLILNLVGGPIPAFFGTFPSLKMLNLSYNPFNPGKIPAEFGNLSNLQVLWCTNCNLVGEIPDTLRGLKHLKLLDLSMNRLSGSFPAALTELPNVAQIEMFNNSLSGVLPDGLSKLRTLRLLDLSMNNLVGSIPGELCELPGLESINMFENRLEGSLPECLGASTTLKEIKLFGNRLSGELPRDLGKYSPLKSLDISDNLFTGRLPPALCEKGALIEIMMLNNLVSGELPASLGKCHSLIRIRLANNNFSGHVPDKLWGLSNVSLLELSNNSFSGPISKQITNSKKLSLLLLSYNNFSGTIPEGIGSLQNMVDFSADHNKFVGSFPESLTKLKRLGKLDLQHNMFSGLLGDRFEAWGRLNELNLANNNFSGVIPQKIASLPVLNYLDLSGNQFSGAIPDGFQNLNLNVLNLSYNHLTGTLPSYFETPGYKYSFLGNPDLCREGNDACKPVQSIQKEASGRCIEGGDCIWMLYAVLILVGALLLAGVIMFHIQFRKFLRENSLNIKSKWTVICFHKVSFDENEIVDSLDENNVIGSGGSGQVYKVALGNGKIIAVKKLWAEAPSDSKSVDLEKNWTGDDAFDAEVKTLSKIRHNNIVKLWCCCTNADCKLLVYEYMPNGSLGDMLHGGKSELLDWPIRYKIALNVAQGLSYLHHDCVPPIAHRDVKSNNILLDADFGARIADFGVAAVVDISEDKSNSVVAGSCGYIAPEYAYSLKVNTRSDIFSFGMVILELITGRRPTDPKFEENDLVKWVCTTMEQKDINHILDPKLDSCHEEEMFKVLNIGLLCCSPLPVNRPSMRQVVVFLEEVRTNSHLKIGKKVGRLTPYYFEDASDSGNVV